MKAGTVDSRRRTDRETVKAFIAEAAPGTVVVNTEPREAWVSGRKRRRERGDTPDLEGAVMHWQMMDRNYAQNQRMVNDSDMIFAFVAPERTGCTEDTILRAKRAGKSVKLR